MLTVDEARALILENLRPLDPLELPITEAHGCVLAEDVAAAENIPPFHNSAMDGYAVRSVDLAGAAQSPVGLTINGESAAGRPYQGRCNPGECVRIFTGAPMPEGADAVVPQEDVVVVGSSMAIGRSVRAGECVRPAGDDLSAGMVVLERGQRLRGMDVGVLAALGRTRVLVRPRARTVVFSTGDELIEPGQALGPGQIRDSNSYTIAGMVREAGGEPVRAGIVADQPRALEDTILSYLPQADIFITSGGVSVGEHDYVKGVLEKVGKVDFWRIAVKPGKPLAFGFVEGRPFFGLPGNPVAVAVTFELFVRPAIHRLVGRASLARQQVEAVFDGHYRQETGRETYLRVTARRTADGWHAALAGKQGSHISSGLAAANALAIMPPDATELLPGAKVRLMLLEPTEGWA